jgi:hypothetical protein
LRLEQNAYFGVLALKRVLKGLMTWQVNSAVYFGLIGLLPGCANGGSAAAKKVLVYTGNFVTN